LQALSELHDQIPPFPRTVAMKIIEEELGSPVESFFCYISNEPVAAASFGQVTLYATICMNRKILNPYMHIYLEIF
jgi:aarF domain-containing kinase